MEIEAKTVKLTKNFISDTSPKKLLLTVVILSVVLGVLTGYILSNKKSGGVRRRGKNARTGDISGKCFWIGSAGS